jgi:cysteine desulfurase
MPDDGYFDYAAAAPPFPEALRRFEEVSFERPGNPSSSHHAGAQAREVLESARAGLLAGAGLPEGTLVVTSGATEANNLVIRSVMEEKPDGRLLLAADVHPSAWFAKELYPKRTDLLETGPDGRISPERLASSLRRKTVLVSVLGVNNETGVIQEVAALGAACARRGIPLHCDGVQALGRLPVSLSQLPVAYYTFSAHKFGGLRGVGGAFVKGAQLRPQIAGGGQEGGARGGTENVAGLAAALVALNLSQKSQESEIPRLRGLARLLSSLVRAEVPQALENSDPDRGLPGLVSLSFPNLVGEEIVVEMNLRGFALSAGSACGSGKMQPSRPVLAMGRTRAQALGTVRISMGRGTTEASVRRLASALKEVVEKQKALAG